jgi:hypothetical protein
MAVVGENGASPSGESFTGADAIAAMRTRPDNVLLFRGFGPLVAAVVLFVLMLLLAPSAAPEHIIERPVTSTTTTTTVAN